MPGALAWVLVSAGAAGVPALLLACGGALALWRCTRARRPFRAGPWPGLTARGASVLLACSALLASGHILVGNPRRAWPDLVLVALVTLVPSLAATRVLSMPGAAAAVSGAYLLPRSLVSLIAPEVDPPPLVLVAAVAFDLCAWLRPSDLDWIRFRRTATRRRNRPPRIVRPWRAMLAGACFGAVLAAVVPPFAVLLGSDPSDWSDTLAAGGLATAGCAVLSRLGLAGPCTGSRPPAPPTP